MLLADGCPKPNALAHVDLAEHGDFVVALILYVHTPDDFEEAVAGQQGKFVHL